MAQGRTRRRRPGGGGFRAGPIPRQKQRPTHPGGDGLPSFDPDGSPPGPGPAPIPGRGSPPRGLPGRAHRIPDRGPTPGLGYGAGGKKGGLPKGYNDDPRTPVKSTGLPYGVAPGSTPIEGSNGYGFYGPGVGPDQPWSPTNVGGYGGPGDEGDGGGPGPSPAPGTPPRAQPEEMNTGAYNQAKGGNKKWKNLQQQFKGGKPKDIARIRQMMMKATNYTDGTPSDGEVATWLRRQQMGLPEQDQQRIRTLTQGLGGKLADPMSDYNLAGQQWAPRGQGLVDELGSLLNMYPNYNFDWSTFGGPNTGNSPGGRAKVNRLTGVGDPSEIWEQLGFMGGTGGVPGGDVVPPPNWWQVGGQGGGQLPPNRGLPPGDPRMPQYGQTRRRRGY